MFSRAISRVKWLSGEKTTQPFDPAGNRRELHHTIRIPSHGYSKEKMKNVGQRSSSSTDVRKMTPTAHASLASAKQTHSAISSIKLYYD